MCKGTFEKPREGQCGLRAKRRRNCPSPGLQGRLSNVDCHDILFEASSIPEEFLKPLDLGKVSLYRSSRRGRDDPGYSKAG